MNALRKLLAVAVPVMLFSCQLSPVQADRSRFKKADANGDGKLSLEEANQYELARVFKNIDINENGSISLDEAKDVGPEYTKGVFDTYDINTDGKVNYQEFYKVQVAKGGVKNRFTAADSDHDGFVTYPEADARVKFLDAQATGSL